MKAILAATWAAVLLATALPAAAAQPAFETRRVKVDYSDLNLGGSNGVSTLEQRVAGAVRQVCDGPAFELNDKIQQRACERSAATRASGDIQNAITTARQSPRIASPQTAAPAAAQIPISSYSRPWSGRGGNVRH